MSVRQGLIYVPFGISRKTLILTYLRTDVQVSRDLRDFVILKNHQGERNKKRRGSAEMKAVGG